MWPHVLGADGFDDCSLRSDKCGAGAALRFAELYEKEDGYPSSITKEKLKNLRHENLRLYRGLTVIGDILYASGGACGRGSSTIISWL